MFKFVIQCIILAAASWLTMYLLHEQHRPYQYHANKFTDIDTTYQVINLGTSHGWAFDYQQMGLNGSHFNREGNTLYYDFQNYKYLKPYLNGGATIILPISFFSFNLDENRNDRGKNGPFVNAFYDYLPKKDIHEYSYSKKSSLMLDRSQDNFNNLIIHNYQKLWPKKSKDTQPPSTKPNTAPKKQALDSTIIRKKHLKYLKKHAKLRVKQVLEKEAGEITTKNIEYLSSLIEDAQKEGYQLVFVTTPFHQIYLEGIGKEWIQQHCYQHLIPLSKKYNIPILDYSHDERFRSHDELFHDSDHLSDVGKQLFNQIFLQDLKELYLIQH